ncbi:hypothetical protein Tco_0837456 [Tanacetum coccineum]
MWMEAAVVVVVEDEARGGAWSSRSDRSGGEESFGTQPENSTENDSWRGVGWCFLCKGWFAYLLNKVVQVGTAPGPNNSNQYDNNYKNGDEMQRVRTFEKQYPQNKVQQMGGARGGAYTIDGEIWYSVVSSRMNQLY